MAVVRNSPKHSTDSTNVADLLERVLDKGVVIAGDIKVSLLDIELLTVQIRLVVCSIDKAKEMGMDWWANSPVFGNDKKKDEEVKALTDRLASLEAQLAEAKALADRAALPAPAAPLAAHAPADTAVREPAAHDQAPPEQPRRFRPVTEAPPPETSA